MQVRDIMRSDVPVLSPRDTVCRAARLMRDGGHNALPVADADGQVVGLLTEWDVLAVALPQYMDGADLSFMPRSTVFPICDRRVLEETLVVGLLRPDSHQVVSADDPVVEVARIMVHEHVRACPVVEGNPDRDEQGPLVGMIFQSDLLRLMVEACGERTGP